MTIRDVVQEMTTLVEQWERQSRRQDATKAEVEMSRVGGLCG